MKIKLVCTSALLHDGVIHVRDLDSSHGTLVNGQPIAQSPLADGDLLQFGLTHFRVQLVGPSVHDSAEFAAVT